MKNWKPDGNLFHLTNIMDVFMIITRTLYISTLLNFSKMHRNRAISRVNNFYRLKISSI